jgi:hypothetical protein
MNVQQQYESAIVIFETLIKGIDPCTGEAVPEDSFLHSSDVIRALFTGLETVKALRLREERRSMQPFKTGSRWSAEEEDRLKEAYSSGTKIPDLARTHQRSITAIETRLEKLGLITADERTTANPFVPATELVRQQRKQGQ